MSIKSYFVLLFAMSLLTACSQATPTGVYPPPGSIPATPTNIPYPPPTSIPTAVPPTPTQIPADLTPAQKAAVQAVATKYSIPVEQIQIVSTEAITWPTGCLGVVVPGVMCTDVVTPGFRIMLSANGQQFEIHTNQDGSSVIDAAQQLATLGFVVAAANQTIQVVNPTIPLGPTYNPAFTGFLPAGGATAGTAYVLDTTSLSKALAVDASTQKDLSFIQKPTYGLALWRGGPGVQPRLAWGTQLYPDNNSSLMIANLDGSNLETLLTINTTAEVPVQLVAEVWSQDGQSVYFSKEPVGLGGYILFSGASNLNKIDINTKQVTEIVPQTPPTSPQTCLDAISGDYRFVADHCTQGMITIRDLQKGTSSTIQAPTDVTGYRLMGSSRFSPSGDRVAFALAQGNPDNERGWVAIAPSSGGASKLILTGDAGSYYTVQGWLDDQTLLVESIPVMCTTATCSSQLYTVGVDGSNPTKVADGKYLTIIDNR
jgi:hypothetical protein